MILQPSKTSITVYFDFPMLHTIMQIRDCDFDYVPHVEIFIVTIVYSVVASATETYVFIAPSTINIPPYVDFVRWKMKKEESETKWTKYYHYLDKKILYYNRVA